MSDVLTGDRAGCLHIVTSSAKESDVLLSQLRVLIRPMYSNPPLPGARIVETILNDKALAAQWCVLRATRIHSACVD